MRTMICVLALVLSASGLASAQEDEYVNTQDGFKIYFPAPPAVKEITFTSQQNFKLPGRVYSVDRGKEHYAVTVIDYSGIEQMGKDRVKTCPAGAPLCRGTALSGPGLWMHDVREATEYSKRSDAAERSDKRLLRGVLRLVRPAEHVRRQSSGPAPVPR